MKLKLLADAGKYGALDFSHLKATIAGEGGVIYLQGLEAGMYGGTIAAKGRIAPIETQGSRYDLNLNLARIQAERLFQALNISREVTGTLFLQGDITARGATLSDVKKSSLGNFRLRLEEGSLRKFSVLSKLFSILNFSQLLKFQLPDMIAGGMPYNEIKGSFSVRDGITSTKDLFIKGDALNISMIGSADIVKEELDFTIGVQPLQTVDKIVNRIPVVGWLLTGKDKAFLTAYFEAKGKWSDPVVKAIPVKSVSKGVLNIFKRVFELPVRVFTDTGEVFLGK
nr:AsmA-like C-terminal region-containing protein [Pelotalea chapellei]